MQFWQHKQKRAEEGGLIRVYKFPSEYVYFSPKWQCSHIRRWKRDREGNWRSREQRQLCISHQEEVMTHGSQLESSVWALRLLAGSRVYSSWSSLWLHTLWWSSPRRSRTPSQYSTSERPVVKKNTKGREPAPSFVFLCNQIKQIGFRQQTCSPVKLI